MSESNARAALPSLRAMAGFSLFELIITIALVAILAGLAMPSYREFSIRMNVSNNVNQMVGALNSARSEAVKRGRQVALIANGGDWNNGWQIVAGKVQADGTVLPPVAVGSSTDCTTDMDLDGVTPVCPRFDGPVTETYTVLGNATGPGADDTRVVFGGTGVLIGATTFDFSVCRPSSSPDPTQSRQITVAASGIITTHRDTSSSPAGTCS